MVTGIKKLINSTWLKSHKPAMSPSYHKQVPCKVTTYVDEKIKELVEILNTFDGVSTFESCQGRNGKLAYVYMEYGENEFNFEEVAGFAYRLASILARIAKKGIGISPEPIYDVNLSIEWWGDKKRPFVSIKFPPAHIKEITNIFADVQRVFENDKKNILP